MAQNENELLGIIKQLLKQEKLSEAIDLIEENLRVRHINAEPIMEVLYEANVLLPTLILQSLSNYPANLLGIIDWVRDNLDPLLLEIFGKVYSELPDSHKKSIELRYSYDWEFLDWLRCFDRELYICPPTLHPALQQVAEKLSLHLSHHTIKLIEAEEAAPYPLSFATDDSPIPLYPIDQLLGTYIPEQQTVKLYQKEIEEVAGRLGVKAEAVRDVVLLHEAVHTVVHLGKDADGDKFETQAYLLVDNGIQPSPLHELVAQLICYHCVKNDQVLYDCFLRLDRHQPEIYRHWRDLKNVPLEKIRGALIRLRRGKAQASISTFLQHL